MERLKILFFVSPKVDADPIHHELITRLAHGLEPLVEVELHASGHGVDGKQLARYDVLHVFGCWHAATTQLLQKAHKHHVPSVCTPLGGLQPWVMKAHAKAYTLAAQRQAVQQASAVHVCGKLEHDLFGKLGWNRRVALIKNPVLTSQLTFDDMASAMAELYRKVLDTNARLLLSEPSCRAIGDLLQLGVDKEVMFDEDHAKQMRENLDGLSDADWRRIWIYAADEHVTAPLSVGLDRLSYAAPQVDASTIDRFAPARLYDADDLREDGLCFKSSSLQSKLKANLKAEETNERRLCVALLNYRHEVEHHTAPLFHLANLYALMRFADTDEDRLREVAQELGIDDFGSRLMYALRQVMRLSEGFMPFSLADDKQSRKLCVEMTKFNTWLQ